MSKEVFEELIEVPCPGCPERIGFGYMQPGDYPAAIHPVEPCDAFMELETDELVALARVKLARFSA